MSKTKNTEPNTKSKSKSKLTFFEENQPSFALAPCLWSYSCSTFKSKVRNEDNNVVDEIINSSIYKGL